MRLFMLVAGLLLLLSPLRLRATARTVPFMLYAASLVCGGLGLIVWVPDNSVVVDRVLHTPGIGHLLTIWFITLCFALQLGLVLPSDAGDNSWTRFCRWNNAILARQNALSAHQGRD